MIHEVSGDVVKGLIIGGYISEIILVIKPRK